MRFRLLVVGLLLCASHAVADETVKIKRRHAFTDEELRKQLLRVPEVGLDQAAEALFCSQFPSRRAPGGGKAIEVPSGLPFDIGPKFLTQYAAKTKQPQLAGVTWIAGEECQTGKERAETMKALSVQLRAFMRLSTPPMDTRPDPDQVRKFFVNGDARQASNFSQVRTIPDQWKRAEAVPTLTQMLQAENTPLRLLLVEMLADIKGKEAGEALARRALFDLAPEVREKAVEALAKRPAAEYVSVLVSGFRWPWAPVADHAAEAIEAIKPPEAFLELVSKAEKPDPSLPRQSADGKSLMVTELVRINHLSNCVVCHAPSSAPNDLVRGQAPIPGEETVQPYYGGNEGFFVRADVTFLRQDFSVPQPVLNPYKWPGIQRFDYLLRDRKATPAELKLYNAAKGKKQDTYPQREALLSAMRTMVEARPTLGTGLPTPLLKAIRDKE
jgi:hypothetical protein